MGEISNEFRADCLKIHNEYRAIHDSPDLTLDKKLNVHAQTRATYLADGDHVSLGKSIPYGENVYKRRITDPDFMISAEEPVRAWFLRHRYHVYGEAQPANLQVVKKFTQLVWKDTTLLGVGMATSPDGIIYVVCNYDPIGNVEDEFDENVLPAKEEDKTEVPPPEKVEVQSVQPNKKVVKSLGRLYAVPSEMLRVWTVWLSKVGDEVIEWYKWIHLHTDLITRMANNLRLIEVGFADDERSLPKSVERIVPKGSVTAWKSKTSLYVTDENLSDDRTLSYSIGGGSDQLTLMHQRSTLSKPSEDVTSQENPVDMFSRESEVTVIEAPRVSKTDESPATEDQPPATEDGSPATEGESPATEDESPAVEDESPAVEDDEETYEVPIGVPWKPLGQPDEEQEKPEPEPTPLEMPKDREEMIQYKKDFMHQATIYISLYKHWKETADRAIKELIGRTVMQTSTVHKINIDAILGSCDRLRLKGMADKKDFIRDLARAQEKIPYFFYVKAEPDIDVAIEFNDEEVFPFPGREHVFGDFKCLYFNLIDQPGTSDEPKIIKYKPIKRKNKKVQK